MAETNISGERLVRTLFFAFNVPFIKAPLMIICGVAALLKTAEQAKDTYELKKARPALVVEEDNPWVAND